MYICSVLHLDVNVSVYTVMDLGYLMYCCRCSVQCSGCVVYGLGVIAAVVLLQVISDNACRREILSLDVECGFTGCKWIGETQTSN